MVSTNNLKHQKVIVVFVVVVSVNQMPKNFVIVMNDQIRFEDAESEIDAAEEYNESRDDQYDKDLVVVERDTQTIMKRFKIRNNIISEEL